MAKVKGPLMSMEASGTVAGSIVFSSNRGRQYVRQHVIPHNPQSPAQTGVRVSMKGLVALYQSNKTAIDSAFHTRAVQLNISQFNAFTGFNQKRRSEGKYAANSTTPSDAAPSANASSLGQVVSGRYVTLTWTDSVSADAWTNMLYRKLGADPTGAPSELVGMVKQGDRKFIDGPLASGAWHYVIAAVSKNGGQTTVSAAVTATIA